MNNNQAHSNSELTITGLTPIQKMICEILWRMPTMHAVNDLCAAGGPEYYAMRDLMISEQFDKTMEVKPEVIEYLAKFQG